jgi:S-formylglutathione hydrolase FrmB
MGGFGALLIAAKRPDLASAVVAESPAVFPSYHAAIAGHPGTFDSAADWAEWGVWNQAASIRDVAVRINCGNADPFEATARALLTTIPGATGSVGSGCHRNSFWRSNATDALHYLATHLS